MRGVAWAPGRVNLIGDHVDYVGGLVLPMAVQLGTRITFETGTADDDVVELTSTDEDEPVRLALPVGDPAAVQPAWGRYVAGVVSVLDRPRAFRGRVESDLPIGAGLSSSSSLAVAVALAGGGPQDPGDLARLCRAGETAGTGVPGGIMDQLTIAAGEEGAALLIDCRTETWEPVTLPEGVAVHAVHCGVPRQLVGSPYAERRAACEEAERHIGPLREADLDAVGALADDTLGRRARHVVTELGRVADAATAARDDDAAGLGRLMVESHASLRDDFEVSIPALDELVDRLCAIDGVHGARLTGAGFGGCVVALADEAVDVQSEVGGWRLEPSAGASLTVE